MSHVTYRNMPAKPFPLSKLAGLAARRATEPLAKTIAAVAKRNHLFRHAVVLPVANAYNFYDVRVKLSLLKVAQRQELTEVPPLPEEKALQLGSNVLAELLLATAATALAAAELARHRRVDEKKEEEEELWFQTWTERSEHLENDLKALSADLGEICELITDLRTHQNEL